MLLLWFILIVNICPLSVLLWLTDQFIQDSLVAILLGKSFPLGFLDSPPPFFFNCRCPFPVWAGCEIRLCRFLTIAFLSTWSKSSLSEQVIFMVLSCSDSGYLVRPSYQCPGSSRTDWKSPISPPMLACGRTEKTYTDWPTKRHLISHAKYINEDIQDESRYITAYYSRHAKWHCF